MKGRIVSVKMKDTVVVIVERVAMHALYKKTFARSKKYLVASDMTLNEGDIVEFVKVKPISKNKHWKVTQVLGRDLAEIVETKQKAAVEAAIAEVMPEEKIEEPQPEAGQHMAEKAKKEKK